MSNAAAPLPMKKRGELARLKALVKIQESINWLDRTLEYFPVEKRSRIGQVIRLLEEAEKTLDSLGEQTIGEMIATIEAGGVNGL